MNRSIFFNFLCLYFVLFSTTVSLANNGQPSSENNKEEVIPEILVQTGVDIFRTSDQTVLAVTFENHPHWHTYWSNPGDAGLPTQVYFYSGDLASNNSLQKPDKEKSLKDIVEFERPSPLRFIENGDLWAYGHEGRYTYFYKIPDQYQGQRISIFSTWLVCKHICVPGKWSTTLELPKWGQSESNSDDQKGNRFLSLSLSNMNPITLGKIEHKNNGEKKELINRWLELPKITPWPSELKAQLVQVGEKELELFTHYQDESSFQGGEVPESVHRGVLIPYNTPPLNFGHEVVHFRSSVPNELGLRTKISWDGEYLDPPISLPKNGKFSSPYNLKFIYNPISGEAPVVIQIQFANFLTGKDAQAFLNKIEQNDSPESRWQQKNQLPIKSVKKETATKTDASESQQGPSFIVAFLLAILGGFILNFMPCVLPVISLKLFSLLKNRDENPRALLKHNLSYSLGILVTFFVLGSTAIALKVSGEVVGWGMQLQSPRFVAIMIIVIFLLSLNLFGLFEFFTPGGKKLGNFQAQEGFIGDFMGGVLATILSTPCSAPFLGTAVTFAFTRGSVEMMAIFLGVGLGLALPFLLTSVFPKIMTLLPKPGSWMEDLKKFLGLTLILTTIWLLDVFQSLTEGTLPSIILHTILALLFFAFYYSKHISKKFLWRIIFFAPPLIFATQLMLWPNPISKKLGHLNDVQASDLLKEKVAKGLPWKPWSVEAMDQAKNEGRSVFIDFTANWCFTCKANEKLVLETGSFQKLVEKEKPILLLGDWTKRDEIIGQWLLDHGAAGVPAYYVQTPAGKLKFLGETISVEKIANALGTP